MSKTLKPPNDELVHDKWFENEVRCHEPLARAWLLSQSLSSGDIDEILQDAYLKICEARKAVEIKSPKAYLMATVRNNVYMRLRREKIVQNVFISDMDTSYLFESDDDIARNVERSEELELLTRAIQLIPKRCRRVLTLMKIYGMSQKQVAAELGISVNTVECQSARGMRRLSRFFERYKKETGR